MIPSVIDWPRLKGQTLQTISGAPFMVVRVTAQYVTVRPKNGTRNYALSIAKELEPIVAAFATNEHLPKPAELSHLGVRPMLSSYAWGVLHAVLAPGASAFTVQSVTDADFAGLWRIIDLPDLGPGYFEPEAGVPRLQIGKPNGDQLRGNYQIGFEAGALTGHLRDFGGERVWVFEYASVPVDSNHGCGWARLLSPTALEGEFVDRVGRFMAERQALPERRRRQSKRPKQ